MEPYTIILADDHVLFCEGLKRIIGEFSDLKVVGVANDGLQLLSLLKESTPDLVILDISMPNMKGIEATREIKATYPDVKVLILTMHKDMDYLYHAISAGADGYLLKENSDTELFSAIDTIRRGKSYISSLLTGELTDNLQSIYRGDYKSPVDSLSKREREIFKLIAEGKLNREIADILFISIRTVENHRARIMKKLNVKKTVDLVRYAIKTGIV